MMTSTFINDSSLRDNPVMPDVPWVPKVQSSEMSESTQSYQLVDSDDSIPIETSFSVGQEGKGK
jgi:hypothetical protein